MTAKKNLAQNLKTLWSGMDAFQKRLERQKALYSEVLSWAERRETPAGPVSISDPVLFTSVLEEFGPAVSASRTDTNLGKIYDAVLDLESGALIIANRGATLFCLSPKTETPYLTRHIGMALYIPGLGIETVNAGLIGDVYSRRVVCRAESACTPSFIFGSQRCNCAHQWDSFRELAASFNRTSAPQLYGAEFEEWVRSQLAFSKGRHVFKAGGPGFVSLHLDSQNGMGSGATAGEFSVDLFNRASLRHRGEYSAEQILPTTMAGGFRAIGINPDPRGDSSALGYKVLPIVLDYLGVSRDLVLLSNNRGKISALESRGYEITRLKSLGAVNAAGSQEATERGTEFGHLDINGTEVSFKSEMQRLREEVKELMQEPSALSSYIPVKSTAEGESPYVR